MSIIIAVFTRKAAAGITLFIPFLPGDIEVVSSIHAQYTETGSDAASNLGKESFLKTIRNIVLALPRNTTRAAFQGMSDYEIPTDTIINLLLSLQANDDWSKGKVWETHPNSTVPLEQMRGE
jgi:hypothetical protein